jgi:hypothetical protein
MEKDYASKIKQMRNLALFRDKTDEEIIEWIKKREERQRSEEAEAPVKTPTPRSSSRTKKTDQENDDEYEALYNEKFAALQKEYGVDMNISNDAEMIRSLARHIIQSEIVNRQIIRLQQEDELDTRTLKNLGDYQKGLLITITDLQEKLGIGRRQRKEKQLDSVPQFVELVRSRAREVWERSTHSVKCANCEIELARYWLNFPDRAAVVQFEIECWKCGERVLYNR